MAWDPTSEAAADPAVYCKWRGVLCCEQTPTWQEAADNDALLTIGSLGWRDYAPLHGSVVTGAEADKAVLDAPQQA